MGQDQLHLRLANAVAAAREVLQIRCKICRRCVEPWQTVAASGNEAVLKAPGGEGVLRRLKPPREQSSHLIADRVCIRIWTSSHLVTG